MYELENWGYDAASDQTIIEILDRPHQVPQMIPNISGQSRTNYRFVQTFIGGISAYHTFNTVYPEEVRITPFFVQEASPKLMWKQDIDN